jgi:hydrogenase maturation protease
MGLGRLRDGPTILIIGLGNELLADDAVGIRVLRELRNRLPADKIAFEELSVGGLPLLEHLVGYDRCILVDAVVTGKSPAGTLHRFVQEPGHPSIRLSSSHHVDLSQVLALGEMLGAAIPAKVVVYGIEPEDTITFCEQCTSEVSKAIPQLVELICRDIEHETTLLPSRSSEQDMVEHFATS